MRKIAIALTMLAVSGVPLAQAGQSAGVAAPTQAAAPAPIDDATFVSTATMSNLAEVTMGELAMEKSANEEVRKHARLMVDDHKKVQQQLDQVSNLPKPQEVDSKGKQMVDRLKAASGADFDRLYVEMQAVAHEEAIQLYTRQVQAGSNGELKRFASDTLPKLREHLTLTQALAKALGISVAPSKAS